MSQENVEIVRRFYEAGLRSIDAYRRNPRADPDDLAAQVFTSHHDFGARSL